MTAMVLSDWIAESMLDLLSVSIKITRLAAIAGHGMNIQEAAYRPSATRMRLRRILGFTHTSSRRDE